MIDTVRTTIEGYTGEGLNGHASLTMSADQSLFTVVVSATIGDQRTVSASLIVRITADKIIIEHDNNFPPLVDALLQAGIPREKIVLAYAGEPVPEAAV
jgi:hypothetical protein